MPVNIKVTDTTHADNLNCKLGIYFALTGRIPAFPNEINWLSFFEKQKEGMTRQVVSQDYYFLIISKKDKNDVFVNSLKGLQELQANGNNLPFQCKWDLNRIYKERTLEEAKAFLLKNFAKSVKLRAEIYFQF